MKKLIILFTVLFNFTCLWSQIVEVGGINYSLNGDNTAYVCGQSGKKSVINIPETINYSGGVYKVTGILQNAFAGCVDLQQITLPSSLTLIGKSAFFDCEALKKIVIPQNVTTIANSAFCNCFALESVSLPEALTEIGNQAFASCYKLKSLKLPSSLTTIGTSTFTRDSLLSEIIIPKSVTSIAGNPFVSCPNISITVEQGNPTFEYLSDCKALINKEKKELVTGFAGTTIPTGVESIADDAFAFCEGLKQISIPETVTKIGWCAFDRCTGLESVTFPSSLTTIDAGAFESCSALTSLTFSGPVENVGMQAFYLCSALKSININSIDTWLKSDFSAQDANPLEYAHYLYLNGNKIKDLIIPSSITNIGKNAFIGGYFESVSIPESVKDIGASAFAHTKITSLSIPKSVSEIEEYTFSYAEFTSIDIPESVTTIGPYAFYSSVGLTDLHLPEGLTYIGEQAFGNCQTLKSVVFPNSLTEIRGMRAFQNCKSLESVILPETLTKIAMFSFSGCINLNTVICKAVNVPNVDYKGLESIDNATLYVPASAIDSYKTTSPWSSFGTILPIEVTGINNVIQDENDNILYDLSGHRVNNTHQGVVISNGRKYINK